MSAPNSFQKLKDSAMWYTTSTGFSAVMLFILMMSNCLDLVLGSQGIKNIFLNSPENCTTGNDIIVDKDDAYLIKTNMDPDNSSSTFLKPISGVLCSLRFKSSTGSGTVCIAQVGPMSSIDDAIPELLVHDGKNEKSTKISEYNDDKFPDTGYRLRQREVCTSQEYLYFSLNTRDPSKDADIGKVVLAFQVYAINNVHRVLFLDEHYGLDSRFTRIPLQDSWLSVYNRVPLSFDYYGPRGNRHIQRHIGLTFETVRSSICVALIPLDNWSCESPSWYWELGISDFQANRIGVKCTDPPAKRMLRTCFKESKRILDLTMQRVGDLFTGSGPKEPLNMFRLVVTDDADSVEDLNEKLETEMKDETPAKPVLAISPASGDFDEGSKVTLTCTTTTTHNHEGVTYTFSKDGAEVKETELGAPNHYVIEKYATASHAGSYTCAAVGYVGSNMMYYLSDTSEAHLVYAKGKGPTTTAQTTTEDDRCNCNALSGSSYMTTSVMLLAMSTLSTVNTLFFTSQ